MALQTVPGVRKAEKSTQGAYIKSPAIVTRTTTYVYDKAGNLIKETDCNGNSIQYDYDAYDRVIRVTDQDGITTRAFYDEEGNITKVVDPEHYDPKKDDGKGETYVYDTMGRLLDVYDKQDGTWQQNVYDATGLRMATVENGTYTGYTYDGDNILAEYNNDDSRTTRYIRGYDLISQKNDAGETYHYLHNAHGDITKLVDTAGKVQNSYSYDAFGNTTSYSENVRNKFRYAGEQYDSITGEYYLRARYYDPAMGRFMNEDTYKGQIENPQSMNLYAYCLNNPVIYTDPSGHYVAEQDNSNKCSSGQGTGNSRVLNAYNYKIKVKAKRTKNTTKTSEKVLRSRLKALRNSQLKRTTKIKSLYSSNMAVDIILRYDNIIDEVSSQLKIQKEMIQSILYRELICYGMDDVVKDLVVRQYYISREINMPGTAYDMYNFMNLDDEVKDSSTGIGQIFASTAIKAENMVFRNYNLDKDNEDDVWMMWQRLQNPETNIYYVGLVLKMEAMRLGINLSTATRDEKIKVFGKYNGNIAYGRHVIKYYDLFKKYNR